MELQPIPSRWTRYFFWFILSSFSVVFAEVLSGAFPFPFLSLWGWIMLLPLYGLHTLVLATVLFRRGRPNLYTLFLAGALFGLYEAYITKVVWSPTWGPALFTVGGVAVVETVVLVLFWHAFLAFILPLVFGQLLLTRSSETVSRWPDRIFHRFKPGKVGKLFLAFAVLAGMTQSNAPLGAVLTVVSALANALILVALVLVWRKGVKGQEKYSMESLLPTRIEFLILLGALAVIYAFSTIAIRREFIPPVRLQAVVWLIYAVIVALWVAHLRKSRVEPPGSEVKVAFSWRTLSWGLLMFVASSALTKATSAGIFIMLGWWLVGGTMGLAIFVFSVRRAMGRAPVASRTAVPVEALTRDVGVQ